MTENRILSVLRKTPKPAFKTIRFFLILMIPVSLGVMLLDEAGILLWVAFFSAPAMGFLGLPGEASLVLLSSFALGQYSAIAVIQSLNLSIRDIIILATFCNIAHSFIIEGAIMKKNGSSFSRILLIRLFSAIAASWVLNLILPQVSVPQEPAGILPGAIGINLHTMPSIIQAWLLSSLFLAVKISLIILAIVFLQKFMEEFGIINIMAKAMAPLMRVFGLSANAGYVWIVAYVIGLGFGAAALIEEVHSGRLSLHDADLFNHHVAISHSQLEDTLLFVAIGAPLLWVALPRFFIAIIVVWLTKWQRAFFRRSFSVKVG